MRVSFAMSPLRRKWNKVRDLAGRTRAGLSDPLSLGRRAMAASLWRLGGNGFEQAMRLFGNLVMTRLLAPDDFGLMAMAMTFQTGLMMATDIGLNLSVVRSERGAELRFLRTAWTIKVIRHAQIALLFVALAAAISFLAARLDFGDTVYADPELPWVMAALAIPLALKGFNSINLALNERRMRMGPFILLNAGTQIVTIASMILFALIEPSVWALVWGGMVGAVVRCVASHLLIAGPRMGFLLDRDHYREIWDYGKWLMGASLFGFLGQQGDRLILGALLAPVDFGVYAIARLWIDAAANTVTRISGPTTTAALSEVRRERPRALFGTFKRIRLLQNAACVGAFVLVAGAGRPMIETLYTATFHGVGLIVVLLSPLLLVRMWASYGTLLLTAGDSRNFATVTLIRSVALFATLPLAFLLLGERWAYFAVAVNGAWGVPQQLRLAARIVPVSYGWEVLQMAAVIAFAAALTVWTP